MVWWRECGYICQTLSGVRLTLTRTKLSRLTGINGPHGPRVPINKWPVSSVKELRQCSFIHSSLLHIWSSKTRQHMQLEWDRNVQGRVLWTWSLNNSWSRISIALSGASIKCETDERNVTQRTERKSTSRIRKWRPIDRAMAPSSHLLHHGGITSSDWFSEILQHPRRQLTSSSY